MKQYGMIVVPPELDEWIRIEFTYDNYRDRLTARELARYERRRRAMRAPIWSADELETAYVR